MAALELYAIQKGFVVLGNFKHIPKNGPKSNNALRKGILNLTHSHYGSQGSKIYFLL